MILTAQHPGISKAKAELRDIMQKRERVAEACRLVESRPTIRGVHIIARGLLSSDELRKYEEYADTHHVKLSIDSHGMISVRPRVLEEK